MYYCEMCGCTDCCERTDLINEPVLCDECYAKEIYGECNCDACNHSYYVGDVMFCDVLVCKPDYDI